jgi:hypothetical protein
MNTESATTVSAVLAAKRRCENVVDASQAAMIQPG